MDMVTRFDQRTNKPKTNNNVGIDTSDKTVITIPNNPKLSCIVCTL